MNEQEKPFGDVGRHSPPDRLRQNVMEQIAQTPQEGRGGASSLRWLGYAALPLAASVALWLAMPSGIETSQPTEPPVVAKGEAMNDATLLAALDDIYGVETTTEQNRYDNESALTTIYGVGQGTNGEGQNDA